MVAASADLIVLFEIKSVDHGIALWSLGPEVVRHVFSLIVAKSWSFENTHGFSKVVWQRMPFLWAD